MLLLVLLAFGATANALFLSSCGTPNSDCTVLSVDSLVLDVTGTPKANFSSSIYSATCAGGGAVMVPSAAVCDPKSNATFSQRQATLRCNIKEIQTNNTNVNLTFIFQDSALYAADGSAACHVGTVSLTNITLQGTLNTSVFTVPIIVPPNSLAAATNTSFSCPGNSYSFAAGWNGTLTMTGLRAQAFAFNASFAPVDANAACSPAPAPENTDSTQSQAGLIVGGIISALALLGIMAFAYSKCRAKSNYELVNSSH